MLQVRGARPGAGRPWKHGGQHSRRKTRRRDSPWPDSAAMPAGCRCRADGYGAGKRESLSGECRRSDDGPGPATGDATDPADDVACMKLARGCPRMRPARVSCSLMPALYAATRSLSCTATVSDRAQRARCSGVLTRIQSGRRAPQPRHSMPSRRHVLHGPLSWSCSSSHFYMAGERASDHQCGGRE